MARVSSRKSSKRSSKSSSSSKRVGKSSKLRPAMKREATECSRIPASRCNAMNPNCQARKAPGRKTKICVRKSGVKKGSAYEGPVMF